MQPHATDDNLYESMTPAEAATLLSKGKCLLFDVRTPPEYASHHIKGAYLLPIQELNARHAEIPRESLQQILIVCEHGIRSVHASQALAINGWKNIVNVSGGMAAWIDAGLPVERVLSPKR